MDRRSYQTGEFWLVTLVEVAQMLLPYLLNIAPPGTVGVASGLYAAARAAAKAGWIRGAVGKLLDTSTAPGDATASGGR